MNVNKNWRWIKYAIRKLFYLFTKNWTEKLLENFLSLEIK